MCARKLPRGHTASALSRHTVPRRQSRFASAKLCLPNQTRMYGGVSATLFCDASACGLEGVRVRAALDERFLGVRAASAVTGAYEPADTSISGAEAMTPGLRIVGSFASYGEPEFISNACAA